MPTSTFDNLDPLKKRTLMKACFDEFSSNAYEVASITPIIKQTGIPKGSIYQYFGTKKDLYQYLIELSQGRRMEYLQDVFDTDGLTFWQLVGALFEAEFRFILENPIQASLLHAASLEWTHPDFGNMKKEWLQAQANSLMYILEREKGRGKMRNDIPTKTMCFLIARVQSDAPELLEYSFNISLKKPGNDPMFGVSKKEIRTLSKDLTKILKSGLRD